MLKIFGQGAQYFKISWNLFDFVIVIMSIFDIFLEVIGTIMIPFLRSGPQIVRVMRVFRISR